MRGSSSAAWCNNPLGTSGLKQILLRSGYILCAFHLPLPIHPLNDRRRFAIRPHFGIPGSQVIAHKHDDPRRTNRSLRNNAAHRARRHEAESLLPLLPLKPLLPLLSLLLPLLLLLSPLPLLNPLLPLPLLIPAAARTHVCG